MNDDKKSREELLCELEGLRRAVEEFNRGQKYRPARLESALRRLRGEVRSMEQADDLENVLRVMVEELDSMGVMFEWANVLLVDQGGERMRGFERTYSTSALRHMPTTPVSEPVREAMIKKQVVYRPDLVREDPFGERQKMAALGVRSIVDVPFGAGTVRLSHTAPHAFSEAEIDVLERAAEILSDGYQRMEDLERLARSEQRYRSLVETPDIVVMLMTPDGQYLYVSPQIREWTAHEPEEFYDDRQVGLSIVHPDDVDIAYGAFRRAVEEGRAQRIEFRSTKRGEVHWVSEAIFPVYDHTGKIDTVQAVFQDITERKRAEEALRQAHGELEERVEERTRQLRLTNEALEREIAERKRAEEQVLESLQQKEVLLKEIHHRVKNNLQVVSSLLDLQSRYIKDPRVLEMLQDSRHRVETMALVHEKLYQGHELAQIDGAEYIRVLVEELFSSYGVSPDAVTLKVRVEEAKFNVDTAIPCGLIVNELISNALKYAFPAGRRGEVRVELKALESGRFALVVSDDGVGLPADIELGGGPSLGLRLVDSLIRQLRGQVEISREGGTQFCITFSSIK